MSRTARLRAAAQKHAARARNAQHDAHNQIAHAVYIAIRDAPEEALLVPELYGPVVVAAEMAAKAVAEKAGLPWNDETRDEIVRYLVDGFTMMTYEFDREHFELHKQRRARVSGCAISRNNASRKSRPSWLGGVQRASRTNVQSGNSVPTF